MGSGDQCAHSRVYGLLQSAKQTQQTHTFNQNKLVLHIKQPSPQSSHAVVGINSKALDFRYTTLLITWGTRWHKVQFTKGYSTNNLFAWGQSCFLCFTSQGNQGRFPFDQMFDLIWFLFFHLTKYSSLKFRVFQATNGTVFSGSLD